jgi:hypothetical protein
MPSNTITYSDVPTKQLIENWGENNGFDAAECIALNLEHRFSVNQIHIVEARDETGFIVLRVACDTWSEPREFALMDTGSLAW